MVIIRRRSPVDGQGPFRRITSRLASWFYNKKRTGKRRLTRAITSRFASSHRREPRTIKSGPPNPLILPRHPAALSSWLPTPSPSLRHIIPGQKRNLGVRKSSIHKSPVNNISIYIRPQSRHVKVCTTVPFLPFPPFCPPTIKTPLPPLFPYLTIPKTQTRTRFQLLYSPRPFSLPHYARLRHYRTPAPRLDPRGLWNSRPHDCYGDSHALCYRSRLRRACADGAAEGSETVKKEEGKKEEAKGRRRRDVGWSVMGNGREGGGIDSWKNEECRNVFYAECVTIYIYGVNMLDCVSKLKKKKNNITCSLSYETTFHSKKNLKSFSNTQIASSSFFSPKIIIMN